MIINFPTISEFDITELIEVLLNIASGWYIQAQEIFAMFIDPIGGFISPVLNMFRPIFNTLLGEELATTLFNKIIPLITSVIDNIFSTIVNMVGLLSADGIMLLIPILVIVVILTWIIAFVPFW